MVDGPKRADDVHVDYSAASAPTVHCLACEYEWHTRVMAEGLRLLGSCPKCGGELEFTDAAPEGEARPLPVVDVRPPHLVLGVPRR
jgi:hypothetical protein